MQYLAEVQKVQGFVGTAKTALKLLARNTNDNWQPITNEQIINTDGSVIKDYKDGQLVIADITGSNQVQTVQDATRRIVTSLQSLSRVQDRFKLAEDEIEQWKQSLQFQAEELHKRETELEERERELEDLHLIREQIEAAQQELLDRQSEFEQMRAELEARGKGLSAEQLAELMQICDQISQSLQSHHSIESALNIIYDRQNILTGFWQELDHNRQQLQIQESQIYQETNEVKLRREQWHRTEQELIDRQTDLIAKERLLETKAQQKQIMAFQLQVQEEYHQQVARIIAALGGVVAEHMLSPEETQRLESMSLDELTAEIDRLQAEFDSFARFYFAQEEELADIEGEIADLRSQIERETDFAKKIELEAELTALQEEYNFQDESISGQRGAFNQRQAIFNQQKAILERRLGESSSDSVIDDLTPLLSQIDDNRQHLSKGLASITEEIASISAQVQQQRAELDQQLQQNHQLEQMITAQEQELFVKYRTYGEAVSRVAVQEAILRPVQDIIDAIRPLLEQVVRNDSLPDGNALLEQLRQTLQSLHN